MRSMWKGTIGYGMAAIPVKAYTATEEHDIELRQLHATDGGRIRQKRVCEVDGEEVPFTEVARGYEMPAGLQGRSLRRPEDLAGRAVIGESDRARALLIDGMKLIVHADGKRDTGRVKARWKEIGNGDGCEEQQHDCAEDPEKLSFCRPPAHET